METKGNANALRAARRNVNENLLGGLSISRTVEHKFQKQNTSVFLVNYCMGKEIWEGLPSPTISAQRTKNQQLLCFRSQKRELHSRARQAMKFKKPWAAVRNH